MTNGIARLAIAAALWAAALGTPAGVLAQVVAAPQEDVAALRVRLRPTMAPPHRPMPRDVATLDKWLASQDDDRIVERLRATQDGPGMVLDMNWEQTRIYDGAGLVVVLAYVNTLWRVAGTLPAADAKGLQDSAAVFSLYALNIVGLDGARCADDSAPGDRFQQVMTQAQPMLLHLRGLSRTDRMTIGSLSVALEAATATVRPDDHALCGFGLEQYRHDLAASAAPPPGDDLAAQGYQPGFLSPEVWGPEQETLRKALPVELTRYLTTAEDDKPAAGP